MFRLLFLSIGNLILVLTLLFFLEFIGVTDIYNSIKGYIKPDTLNTFSDVPLNNVERDIMYKQQFNMAMESILLKEKKLASEKENIEKIQIDITEKKNQIEEKERNLYNRISRLDEENKEKNAYKNRVSQLANNYSNMPPNLAMERILALKDDLLIIDTLNAMDELASQAGASSTVPYILSLMPSEDSGRILKKLAIE